MSADIDAAKGGDMVAARLILERLVPIRKGCPIAFELLSDAVRISKAFAALTHGVAGGALTPEEGQAIGGILEGRRRALEAVELEQRVSELEEIASNE